MKRRLALIVLAGAALVAGCGPTIAPAPEPQEGPWTGCDVRVIHGREFCIPQWEQTGPDEEFGTWTPPPIS